jgi:hypothetical protein
MGIKKPKKSIISFKRILKMFDEIKENPLLKKELV